MNLKIEVVRKSIIFGGLILSASIWGTIEAIAIASAGTTIVTALMVAAVGGGIISFSLIEQMKAISKNIIATACMMLAIYAASNMISDDMFGVITLMLKIFIGVITYGAIAIITKNESLELILNRAKGLLIKIGRKG